MKPSRLAYFRFIMRTYILFIQYLWVKMNARPTAIRII